MGARPLGRVIQEYIKKPLAEELLFGKLTKGGTVHVGVKDGVKIGAHAVVGMNSMVTKDIAEQSIVAGNPAQFIRLRD